MKKEIIVFFFILTLTAAQSQGQDSFNCLGKPRSCAESEAKSIYNEELKYKTRPEIQRQKDYIIVTRSDVKNFVANTWHIDHRDIVIKYQQIASSGGLYYDIYELAEANFKPVIGGYEIGNVFVSFHQEDGFYIVTYEMR